MIQALSLAEKFEELVRSGYLKINTEVVPNAFPTARVVLPVYESGGTYTPPIRQGDNGGKLARHTE